MTLYLLVLNQDGDMSYSLWKTEQSAKSERKNLTQKYGYSLYAFDIIPIDVYD